MVQYGDSCFSPAAGLDVIFNFSRYEELKQAVMQLIRENLDPDLLYEEAHDLFESWWSSSQDDGQWNEEVKERMWKSLWQEFGIRTPSP